MKPIAIFYHCLFQIGDDLLPAAVDIVGEQMAALKSSGLEESASEIYVGINGGDEAVSFSELFPKNSIIVFHGLQCRNECRTIRLLEEWLPGHDDWYILYFHSKGATHRSNELFRKPWRDCMMRRLVWNWRRCVSDLDDGCEAVGCHWMQPPLIPDKQYYFAGNFFWSKASFLNTLPSIMERDRIKNSGIDALESRFESEVWIGNGPRRPIRIDYHPNWTVSPGPHQ